MIRPLNKSEKIQWLQLFRSKNVGPVTFHQLLQQYGTAEKACEALPELAARGGLRGRFRVFPVSQARQEFEALTAMGGQLLASCEPSYSPLLRSISGAPPLLSALGHSVLLEKPTVAIVGARNASVGGRRLAEVFAQGLGEQGYSVVSGMARGVDSHVHKASLVTGTCAVLGNGVDIAYPKENEDLYEQIRHQGLILSEMPLKSQALARNFPRRNRIISGLCLGCVVIEAGLNSGSLITADYALRQGREVFSVPGSPLDPRTSGSNELLRQGATLVENVDDILTILEPLRNKEAKDLTLDMDYQPSLKSSNEIHIDTPARDAIREALSPVPLSVDSLVRHTKLPFPVVATVLIELELAGRLVRDPGNLVSLLEEWEQ